MSAEFDFIDLFAGIGGIRQGFESAGGSCVFTSEWNEFSRKTYSANYKERNDHIFAGDIVPYDEEMIPDHDVLLAGFPCQPFFDSGSLQEEFSGKASWIRVHYTGHALF